ncbi:hypothetical protein L249_4184 [Ophiocordyceps polyrhachis-furcata BCC 54312]|uniref:Uncharacterized protein n=1 Tax=Ophiocordyceps polyrhachis-furcata BCC 54312 TaxID=1330021 RepID=A0A367LCC3_9HYPO|nr:hypothetical protein L249_4184 [Ophiocordyceps polyrhachis-furcata BCC 54312]RCI11884.1 hypothetical protein L249_4184 [Ophiocordyceps polyrhachis-furcata BCC 54312]
MPFLPLLCDVRRPRAGYGRPGVTKFDCLDRPPFLGSLTYPTFLPSYGPYGPYSRSRSRSRLLPAVTYSLCDVRRPRAGYGRPGVTVWRSR